MRLALYYSLNLLVIALWLPSLIQRQQSHTHTLHSVVLVGCNFQTAVVAHYLKAYPSFNVTIVEEGECTFESLRQFPKSAAMVDLLDSINFKYKAVPNSLGFWDGKSILTTDTTTQSQILRFGLSSYALKASLKKFDNWLRKCEKKPFVTIYECLHRLHIETTMTNSKYLLEEVGLDRDYVRLLILPYLRGCEHDVDSNFMNLKLKLVEMFLPVMEFKGSQKDLGFRLLEGSRLLDEQTSVTVSSRNSSTYVVTTPEHSIPTRFVVFCNNSEAKVFYFKTIIKGKIDPTFYSLEASQVPPMIYSNENVVKIKKHCTVSCTKAEANLYIITSKGRVAEKDLRMFGQYEMISWQRYKVPKLSNNLRELPKITDGKGHFYMNTVSTISDSKEFAILFAKNIAALIASQAGGA